MLDGLLYLYIGECLSSIVARILRKVFIFQYMRFYLWLEDSNELTGPIPEEWGGMKDLEQLFVNGNQLSGEIPITIRGMESLHYLRANDNQLSGELPSDIGKMLKMEYIYLEDNDIQGSVPSQLGELSKLKLLHLDGNDLTGDMPSQVCRLKTNFYLVDLSAKNNDDGFACTCCTSQ
jgi:hypothetical protein